MTEAQVVQWLRERDRFLILTHSRPDGDTLGCASALCLTLQKAGKTAWILPNPDLSAYFSDYLELPFAPADYVPDHVVAVDIAAETMFPETDRAELLQRIELCIDHHPSNTHYAENLCLDPGAAAAAEILYRICSELVELDEAIARGLYVGIATDCGCFAYANTTAETHRIAAELLKYVEVKGLNKHFFQTRSFQELRLEAVLLHSEAFYEEGKICIGTVSMADKARFGATEDDCESLASYASAIEGVLCAATIREKKPGRWKLSIRCDADYINGSDVCARIGGGGHAAAAGATLPEGLDEAQARELVHKCIFDQLREQRGNA
jgi:phosphoesterase RecJ-like protein